MREKNTTSSYFDVLQKTHSQLFDSFTINHPPIQKRAVFKSSIFKIWNAPLLIAIANNNRFRIVHNRKNTKMTNNIWGKQQYKVNNNNLLFSNKENEQKKRLVKPILRIIYKNVDTQVSFTTKTYLTNPINKLGLKDHSNLESMK